MRDAERQQTITGERPAWVQLARLREEIDRIDRSLVEVLAERYRLAEEVGTLKGGTGIAPVDPRREAEIVRRATAGAREQGVPAEGVRQLFWAVLDYCREGVRERHREEQRATTEPVAFGA